MTRRTINAVIQFNPAPEYAQKIIAELRARGTPVRVIARRAGTSKRTFYRIMELGFPNFATQFLLEAMSGRR